MSNLMFTDVMFCLEPIPKVEANNNSYSQTVTFIYSISPTEKHNATQMTISYLQRKTVSMKPKMSLNGFAQYSQKKTNVFCYVAHSQHLVKKERLQLNVDVKTGIAKL